jgi:hypothetical protein
MFCRCLIAALTLAQIMSGAGRNTGWQTGTFHLEEADSTGWNGYGVSAARRAQGGATSDPLSISVTFVVTSATGSFRASLDGLANDRTASTQDVFSWLRDMPTEVRFRVERSSG